MSSCESSKPGLLRFAGFRRASADAIGLEDAFRVTLPLGIVVAATL
ncbi:hypothetical protein GFS60_07393 (plasmid) [Rhodococcus sp. WAY2]|nr:hypothetical protein GFS60_07393 [Rhodococcus sp. WAY2]